MRGLVSAPGKSLDSDVDLHVCIVVRVFRSHSIAYVYHEDIVCVCIHVIVERKEDGMRIGRRKVSLENRL